MVPFTTEPKESPKNSVNQLVTTARQKYKSMEQFQR